MQGNWLRCVNWAHSIKEQNLFPLEMNQAIDYNVLRPIRRGEEQLVRYSGGEDDDDDDNPEITAALREEELTPPPPLLLRPPPPTPPPRDRRARRKLLARARRAGLGGFKQTSETKAMTEMWDGDEDVQDISVVMIEGEKEMEVDQANVPGEPQQLSSMQAPQETSVIAESREDEQLPDCGRRGEESPKDSQPKSESASLQSQEPESLDPDMDFDPDPDGDLEGASGRFKRRTSSPPSSPQLSPTQKPASSKVEVGGVYTLKQPLDLSSSVSRRSDVLSKTLGDSALDLSMQRKSTMEPELKGTPPPQPPAKKRKPNTSMLEKLFVEAPALLAHRTSLHGVGGIFVCSECSKEFAFLCNLEQHQKDLHPSQTCTHTTVKSGKLRPHNYTDPSRAKEESSPSTPAPEMDDKAAPQSDPIEKSPELNGQSAEDEAEPEDSSEELYTTIKIMASEGGKPKGPDVRLGLNQHYPSFKPPPFPYHSRSHAGSVASATNFTTHNIPQTFSTAIHCTKCGNSFDNMPELHKHILACANASDKKRYTPKKNPIPLKQIVKPQNGALSPAAASAGQSAFRRMGHPKRLNFNQEPSGKAKMSALNKKKNQLVQKAISQKNKTSSVKKASVKVEEQEPEPHICPHCSREFTYPASLSKHIAISCPMKPEPKKGKKGDVKQEPQMSLRRKATDTDSSDSGPKPLGKTRARSYGAAEPEPPQASKGRTGAPLGRPKRPASFPASPVVPSKKRKKGQAQLPPPPLLDTPSDVVQRPVVKAQRMGKDAAPKKVTDVNAPQQPKKEERFSRRTRERVGGPVTRSLQNVSTVPTVEVKTEQPIIQEPKESQELLLK
ncbi:hypothetical protein CRUP_022051 [Coryphaenoides rupestris]|nr:hypothetical protein CRUP_022051 [Coryphaenoides rupestris]